MTHLSVNLRSASAQPVWTIFEDRPEAPASQVAYVNDEALASRKRQITGVPAARSISDGTAVVVPALRDADLVGLGRANPMQMHADAIDDHDIAGDSRCRAGDIGVCRKYAKQKKGG